MKQKRSVRKINRYSRSHCNISCLFICIRTFSLTCIKQKDFSDISITDITQEAEINHSTFYYHFMDKYDLIDVIQREVLTKEIFEKVAIQEVIDELHSDNKVLVIKQGKI